MARNRHGKGVRLKDELFHRGKVDMLAARFSAVYTPFDAKSFVQEVMAQLPHLALKERVMYIADVLAAYLPADFAQAAEVIVKVLPAPLDPNRTDNDFGDFIYAPLGAFVAKRATSKAELHSALATLREITMRFSMEDAIRTFLNTYPEETLTILKQWTHDEHYHVRRLVSEGTRPRLPWSCSVSLRPEQTIPLLDALYADSTRYVTRSVANHLNDIAKTNPTLVLHTLRRWRKEGRQNKRELQWMARHALRTLVKRGHKDALRFLGYRQNPEIKVRRFSVSKRSLKIAAGDALSFSFDISAQRNEKLMIDYVIDFVKAGGEHRPKVFKCKTLSIKRGQTVTVHKTHPFYADATTYTLYPGVHSIALQINGTHHRRHTFTIEM